MPKIHTILLDLDCVLCDFVAGCCAEWDLTVADVMRHWTPGVYPMNGALTGSLRESGQHEWPVGIMTDKTFWERLNGRYWFWENLPKLPWCDDLIAACYDLVGEKNVHIVSSPSWCPTSYAGKVTWLKREFGNDFNRFALTPHKELFSKPGVILIDDSEANCEKFAVRDPSPPRFGLQLGGQAILFPAHHNKWHDLKDDPLPAVLTALDLLM